MVFVFCLFLGRDGHGACLQLRSVVPGREGSSLALSWTAQLRHGAHMNDPLVVLAIARTGHTVVGWGAGLRRFTDGGVNFRGAGFECGTLDWANAV